MSIKNKQRLTLGLYVAILAGVVVGTGFVVDALSHGRAPNAVYDLATRVVAVAIFLCIGWVLFNRKIVLSEDITIYSRLGQTIIRFPYQDLQNVEVENEGYWSELVLVTSSGTYRINGFDKKRANKTMNEIEYRRAHPEARKTTFV